jgi:hypothetical protein
MKFSVLIGIVISSVRFSPNLYTFIQLIQILEGRGFYCGLVGPWIKRFGSFIKDEVRATGGTKKYPRV